MHDQVPTVLDRPRLVRWGGLQGVRPQLAGERRVDVDRVGHQLEAGHAGLEARPPERLDRGPTVERCRRREQQAPISRVDHRRGSRIAAAEGGDERLSRALKELVRG